MPLDYAPPPRFPQEEMPFTSREPVKSGCDVTGDCIRGGTGRKREEPRTTVSPPPLAQTHSTGFEELNPPRGFRFSPKYARKNTSPPVHGQNASSATASPPAMNISAEIMHGLRNEAMDIHREIMELNERLLFVETVLFSERMTDIYRKSMEPESERYYEYTIAVNATFLDTHLQEFDPTYFGVDLKTISLRNIRSLIMSVVAQIAARKQRLEEISNASPVMKGFIEKRKLSAGSIREHARIWFENFTDYKRKIEETEQTGKKDFRAQNEIARLKHALLHPELVADERVIRGKERHSEEKSLLKPVEPRIITSIRHEINTVAQIAYKIENIPRRTRAERDRLNGLSARRLELLSRIRRLKARMNEARIKQQEPKAALAELGKKLATYYQQTQSYISPADKTWLLKLTKRFSKGQILGSFRGELSERQKLIPVEYLSQIRILEDKMYMYNPDNFRMDLARLEEELQTTVIDFEEPPKDEDDPIEKLIENLRRKMIAKAKEVETLHQKLETAENTSDAGKLVPHYERELKRIQTFGNEEPEITSATRQLEKAVEHLRRRLRDCFRGRPVDLNGLAQVAQSVHSQAQQTLLDICSLKQPQDIVLPEIKGEKLAHRGRLYAKVKKNHTASKQLCFT